MVKHKRGFSIIEVTLFLGLSGLLLVGLTANTSRDIAIKRHTDTVDSLADFFKDIYSSVLNIENTREGALGRKLCSVDSKEDINDSDSQRGRTSCATYGKLVIVGAEPAKEDEPNENVIYVFDIVGDVVEPKYETSETDIIKLLFDKHANYLAIDSSSNIIIPAGKLTRYAIEWDNKIINPDKSDYAAMIAVVRSPSDGKVTTLINETGFKANTGLFKNKQGFIGGNSALGVDDAIKFELGTDVSGFIPGKFSADTEAILCVKSNNFFTSHLHQGVIIKGGGSNASAVLTDKEQEGKCEYNGQP